MKTKRIIPFWWMLISIWGIASAQTVSLDSVFGVRHETVFYGAPINYRGCADSLFIDLYKPINAFAERPIVILVHGGSFVAGGRTAPNLVRLGDSLAARGYVAASIDYRLGHHIPANLSASFGCIIFQALAGIALDACAYPADTAEQYRALYRGMQDAKGAIRFLKGRSALDSTNKNRVFIGGESAGGFVSLAAALLDRESEKPAAASQLADAPTVTGFPCNLNNPCGTTSYSRPDLGSIRGNLHLNGESDEVVGVLSFAGGLIDPAVMDTNLSHPRMYIYHQTCDPVVPCGREKIYYRLNNCVSCSGCPIIGNVNRASGGCAIESHNLGLPANDQFDLTMDTTGNGQPVSCYFGLWGPSLSTCPQPLNTCRYCGNTLYGQCHDLKLNPDRMDSISKFLYDGSTATGTAPGQLQGRQVFPNPNAGSFTLVGQKIEKAEVFDLQGRLRAVFSFAGMNSPRIVLPHGMRGVFLIRVSESAGRSWDEKIWVKE